MIPLFQIIIRIVVIADGSGNSTSLSQLKQKLWAPAEPGYWKIRGATKEQSNSNGKDPVAIHSYFSCQQCILYASQRLWWHRVLTAYGGNLDIGSLFCFLASLSLLPNSLLLFPEVFSQKNYLYPTLVLGSASKEKEHNNNWGLFLITRGLSLWLRW